MTEPINRPAGRTFAAAPLFGDASRLYALEVFREHRTALKTADRADLEALAILLIQKRAVDGLNGRRWDAGAHLYFEDAVTSILAKLKSPKTPDEPQPTRKDSQ